MEYNILSYGAVGDGVTMNTAFIQAAVDACALTGGRVIIPDGDFLTGSIRLYSNVELHLCHSARLVASNDLKDFNPIDAFKQNMPEHSEGWGGYHLIYCADAQNVAITGTGKIDGNSKIFFGEPCPHNAKYSWRRGISRLTHTMRPGQMLCFAECKNVVVRDVTIMNSPCWTCHIHGCEDVTITGVKIFNVYHNLQTDGIDIDTSRRVTVSDCIVNVGDDCITLRGDSKRLSQEHQACEFVTITNCILSANSSAFRIGVGVSPIRHIRVSNIVIEAAGVGINFYPEWANTSHTPIEDVHFSNISATNVGRMIQLNVNNGTPVKNISISNVTAEAMSAARLWCKNERTVENIRLSNVDITAIKDIDAPTKDEPDYRGSEFFSAIGIDDLNLESCRFFAKKQYADEWKSALSITDSTGEYNGFKINIK